MVMFEVELIFSLILCVSAVAAPVLFVHQIEEFQNFG